MRPDLSRMPKENNNEEVNYLKFLDPAKCKLAINWLKEKVKAQGATIQDEAGFEESVKEYIERSCQTIQGKAVLSSSETLFAVRPQKGKSLQQIFNKHGINIGSYIFSITITPMEVLVVDGKGNGRKRVEYDEVNKKFVYNMLRGKRSKKEI